MRFYSRMLSDGLSTGRLSTTDSILVVCGGAWDRDNFQRNGFTDVTISNLNDDMGADVAPYRWARIDAENIPHPANSFDIVAVHGGLHHCFSPHRALLEMYRIARKAVIVIEARDSLLMRGGKFFGVTSDYEIEAVTGSKHFGGAGGGPIPNFVYRWTERDVRKTIAAFDPRHILDVDFFYGLLLPTRRLDCTDRRFARLAVKALAPMTAALQRIFPRQGNRFGWIIWKDRPRLHPWLTECAGIDDSYVRARGLAYSPDGAGL